MKQVLIIGGGFFGMYLADHLARKGHSVRLVEKDTDFMQRASLTNQARVHNGYHYPRSMLTAMRSQMSFPRFCEEFRECIDNSFEKYYLVGKVLGKVTARQFEQFCRRIGAPCEPAPTRITALLNSSLVEAAFETIEYAFDSVKLKQLMGARLADAHVAVQFGIAAERVEVDGKNHLVAVLSNGDRIGGLDHIFNCSYSMINSMNLHSGLPIIPLKHELTEMALTEVPESLRNCGITVMCGPFFSVMPFPSRGLHSFSHVRYTPHHEWYDRSGAAYVDAHRHAAASPHRSAWAAMIRDAARYIPALENSRRVDSMWEVKTVLPRSESDDSRPILFRPNHGLTGYHCVMGGKIDNVYDAASEIDRLALV